jgi:hypothetical protein
MRATWLLAAARERCQREEDEDGGESGEEAGFGELEWPVMALRFVDDVEDDSLSLLASAVTGVKRRRRAHGRHLLAFRRCPPRLWRQNAR